MLIFLNLVSPICFFSKSSSFFSVKAKHPGITALGSGCGMLARVRGHVDGKCQLCSGQPMGRPIQDGQLVL